LDHEYISLQSFLKNQLSLATLNGLIAAVNTAWSASKFSSLEPGFVETELKELVTRCEPNSVGKIKCLLLVLIQLKRVGSDTKLGVSRYIPTQCLKKSLHS
jgi:hypothetical protein